MLNLRFHGIAGNLRAVSDLQVVDLQTGPYLVTVSASQGGLTSWAPVAGGLPDYLGWRAASVDTLTGTGPQIAAVADEVLVAGLGRDEVDRITLRSDGSLLAPEDLAAPGGAWSAIAMLDAETIALAETNALGFSLFSQADNTWQPTRTVTDTNAVHADGITAMTSLTVGTRSFLVTASGTEHGVTLFEIAGKTVSAQSSIGPKDGLGLMVPSAMTVAAVANQPFVLVASAPENDGDGGAISVLAIGPNGELTPTDHILDTRESRFGQIQSLAAVEHGDITLVAAGGGDDGITLMILLSDGRLAHLTTVVDDTQTGLRGVTELEMTVVDDRLQIFASSGAADGLNVFEADLSQLGLRAAADAGGARLVGTDRDDILEDGDGADTLEGRAGADLYILTVDGQRDVIRGFDPGEDRLDLSFWPMIYDTGRIDITRTTTGARIEIRGEILDLISPNNSALDTEAVRSAIQLVINRSFSSPSVEYQGDSTAERIEGSWHNDTLHGGGGNDTLIGGRGDDTLMGGAGADTAVFGIPAGALTILDIAGDRATIISSEGTDSLDGIEILEFTDTTVNFADLAQLRAPVTLTGGAGNDSLVATGLDASLHGLDGDDRLTSDLGEDTQHGGAGNDTLSAGAGQDSLLGAEGHDRLSGGTGQDRLSGGSGNDWLSGDDGKDSLDGGTGADTLNGGVGDDSLRPGQGDDEVDGGAGLDTLYFSLDISQIEIAEIDGTQVTLISAEGTDRIRGVENFVFGTRTLTLSDLDAMSGPTLLEGGNGNDVLRHLENAVDMRGFAGNDFLETGPSDDRIDAASGDDTVRSGRGNDTIEAGLGHDGVWALGDNDTVFGGDGNDTLRGGRESDQLFGGNGNDVLRGQRHADTLYGGDGDDNIAGGGGSDIHFGEDGNDFVKGGTRNDLVDGGRGNDKVIGNRHDDTLLGGHGDDYLNAGGDDDRLDGGPGDDWMRGGPGADVFVFADGHGRDTIDDFNRRHDTFEIDASLAGDLSPAQIIKGARVTADGVLIDFGGGDTILLDGLGSTHGLIDDIIIV